MDKTERQLNLTALLLDARRPLPGDQIRRALYSDAPSDEAFKRMFERDKSELRRLGLSVETAAIGAWDEGYVVRRDEATLPDLGLTPAEHAALMIAAEAWGEGQLGLGTPRMAGRKLEAATGEAPPVPWILPHVDLRSPNVAVLTDAIGRRKVVRFRYRVHGATEASERVVEPHSIMFRSAWYLAGYDRDRKAIRHFKLYRVEGAVRIDAGASTDFDEPKTVDTYPVPDSEPESEAAVAFHPDVAWWVERRGGVRRTAVRPDGWLSLAVKVTDESRFVRWVIGFADGAEVLEPASLRDATIEALRERAAGTG
ncbi:MAG: helix-turn-helix transcriptional regulator [Actinomycetota bacterium]